MPSQRAPRSVLGTVDHLHRTSPNSSQHHSLPHLRQPRARLNLTSIITLRIFCSAPENLRSGRCSRPDHIVQIDRICLLTPHMYFATQDKMSYVWGNVGQRVIGVDETPIFGWWTVISERVMCLERWGVKVEPIAFAAIKVLRSDQYWGVIFNVLYLAKFSYPVVVVSE